jgi:hypothetical protein
MSESARRPLARSRRLRAASVALLLVLVPVLTWGQEELRWRAPRLGTPSQVLPRPIERPFGVPTEAELLLPAEPAFDPSLMPPAVLPPEVVLGAGPPPEPWDPLGFLLSRADDTLPVIREWEARTPPLVSYIVPTKPGVFQKFGVSGTWVEGGTDDRAPAMADLSTFASFVVPFPIREWPLHITPGYEVRWLDGPPSPDLPPAVYAAYVDFTWNLRLTQRSVQAFSIAPGYYSDFRQNTGRGFRFTGKWVSSYDVVRHRITLISGTVYLARDDVKLLPVIGLVFTPSDWLRLEAVFPSPRAALRLRGNEFYEDWLYTGLDFYGGQMWAIERDDMADRMTITDSRAVFGFERRRQGGAGWHLESGWVFDRKIRFRNDPSDDFRPDPTFYVRAGMTF